MCEVRSRVKVKGTNQVPYEEGHVGHSICAPNREQGGLSTPCEVHPCYRPAFYYQQQQQHENTLRYLQE